MTGNLTFERIADATGLSITYAGAIRRGREAPHRRHWSVLIELARQGKQRADVGERWEDVVLEEESSQGSTPTSITRLPRHWVCRAAT